MNTRYETRAEKCIFCGKPAVSGEHVISEFVSRLYNFRKYRSHISRTTQLDPTGTEKVPVDRVRTRSGSVISRKQKIVCAECNTRWMSRVDNNAKSVLDPLMSGHSIKLNLEDQKALSAWLFKLFIVNEYSYPGEIVVSPGDRKFLYHFGTPPGNFSVGIGVYSDRGGKWAEQELVRFCCDLEYTRVRDLDPPKPQSVGVSANCEALTARIGNLTFTAIYSKADTFSFNNITSTAFGQIWPIKSALVNSNDYHVRDRDLTSAAEQLVNLAIQAGAQYDKSSINLFNGK